MDALAKKPTRSTKQIAAVLTALNLERIEELADYTEAQLLTHPYVGVALVNRIKEKLALKGLRLKPAPSAKKVIKPAPIPKKAVKPPARRREAAAEFKPVAVHKALRYIAGLPDIGDPELREITARSRQWLKEHGAD